FSSLECTLRIPQTRSPSNTPSNLTLHSHETGVARIGVCTGAAGIEVTTGAAMPSLEVVHGSLHRRRNPLCLGYTAINANTRLPDFWSTYQIDLFRWLGSPVSCLVLDLILGYYSSRCTCKLECHRPLILAGSPVEPSLVTSRPATNEKSNWQIRYLHSSSQWEACWATWPCSLRDSRQCSHSQLQKH
ncbi:hypothetical protein S83_048066, partial [Arachis hypogaea]